VAIHPVTIREGVVVVDVPEPVAGPISMRERLLAHAREWEAGR
jgi:hypothetical protein